MKASTGTRQMLERVKTHIPGFEDISDGGLPKGRATLVSGSSGSCKTILTLQFLVSGIIRDDEPAVFVTCEESAADIRENVRSFGWDLAELEKGKKLAILDFSPEPGRKVIIKGDYDFSGLMARLASAIDAIGAGRVGIDAIGSLFSQFPDEGKVRTLLHEIAATLKLKGITTVMTAERLEEYGPVGRFGVEDFVSDNVIILRNILAEERVRRTIQILKFRGTRHHKGEFPFTICEDGVIIMPLSSMSLTMASSDTRIRSGVPTLDKMCGGGFFRDSIILASGATGTGKTLLATTFIDQGCRDGEKSMIFAFEESRQQLLRNAIGWNLDFTDWENQGQLKIICDYPEVTDITEHLRIMKEAIDDFKPTRIAVDSLSALERVSSIRDFREFVLSLTAFIKQREAAGLFTAVTPMLMGGSSVTEQHISTLTDSIILMRYAEMMGRMYRGLTVLKMRGSQHEKEIRQYEIDDTGMHIGNVFDNVSGFLTGAPTRIAREEAAEMRDMFSG